MPDLERIDRELAAIGTVPEAVQPLLDQYGQRDRSLENVDVVLAALHEGRDPASIPPEPEAPRPSFLPLGWDAERKSEPGVEPAPSAVALVTQEEITVTSGLPDEMDEAPEVAEVAPAAPAAPSEPEPAVVAPAVAAPAEIPPEPIDTQESFPPPPAESPVPQVASAAPDAAPESDVLAEPKSPNRPSRPPRPDIQALLDTELDPREFPSTNPPPNISRSSPPPPSNSVAPDEAADQDGDFELLVDDDDIMEIEEESE